MASYDRPVKATLYVHLDNGDQFEAGPADLDKFGYIERSAAYMNFQRRLVDTLMAAGLIEREKHITNTKINAFRYLAETAIFHPDLLDHPEMQRTYDAIAAIETALRAANVPGEDY